jgi:hypothetical protein
MACMVWGGLAKTMTVSSGPQASQVRALNVVLLVWSSPR